MKRVKIGEVDGALIVAGLIAELQRHIEIDPERANHPVEIVEPGKARTRLAITLASTGNPDPAMGGPERVMVLTRPAPTKPWLVEPVTWTEEE